MSTASGDNANSNPTDVTSLPKTRMGARLAPVLLAAAAVTVVALSMGFSLWFALSRLEVVTKDAAKLAGEVRSLKDQINTLAKELPKSTSKIVTIGPQKVEKSPDAEDFVQIGSGTPAGKLVPFKLPGKIISASWRPAEGAGVNFLLRRTIWVMPATNGVYVAGEAAENAGPIDVAIDVVYAGGMSPNH